MPIDDLGGRGSVRAQQVAQGRKPGVAGCVRCSLGTMVVAALLVAAPAVRAGALDLGSRGQRRTEGRRRAPADGRWPVDRSGGAPGRRPAEAARRPAADVRAGHHRARVARLACSASHVHPRRSGDSRADLRGPGAVEPDRAGDLQPPPARLEGQLEQRRLPELFHQLVDRPQDRRLRRTRRASLRRAVPDRRRRRQRRQGHAGIDGPDDRSGSQPPPLGPRRHDRALDDARQCAGGWRLQCLDAARTSIRTTPSIPRRRSGARCERRRRRTSTSTAAWSRRCGCRPDNSRCAICRSKPASETPA